MSKLDPDVARSSSHIFPEGKSPQLCRKTFAQRIDIEFHMERERWHCINFLVLTVGLFLCLATYDPLTQISDIHYNLEQQFDTDRARNEIHSYKDIIGYIQTFIDVCYEMAPALIDATTMDAIDFARCTDDSVDDICRLRYWSLDTDIGDGMRHHILNDQLGPENVKPSRMDCPGLPNCIDREHVTSRVVNGRTPGLIPEDPIILQSRLQYAQTSLVPLMPVVWQVRSPTRPCDGFGDKYNAGILGAGLCDMQTPCNPDTVTSFTGTKPSSNGREQTFFFTYSEDVFFCVDRSEYAEVFYDKSWSPWASHHDLTVGTLSESIEFDGKPVFYKFVSDIAYLQQPIRGTIQIDPNHCNGSTQNSCQGFSGTACDPYDESHPMWAEPANNLLYVNCSLRAEWTRRFLQTPIHDRANSFLNLETTELTIAVLIITPQTAAYRDVQTLIRVIFSVGQGGTIEPTISLMSTSQTWWWWYVISGASLCSSVVYVAMGMLFSAKIVREPPKVRRLHKTRLYTVIGDVIVGLLVFSVIAALIIIDLLPPDVTQELVDAFRTDKQSEYFEVLKDIVTYNETLQKVKGLVFVVVCFLFVRLCLFLSLHPRMAIFLKTFVQLGSHIASWSIYFIIIQCFLLCVGWWMFGQERHIEYGTLARSYYTGLQMFLGEFPLHETETDGFYIVYLLVYVGSVSIILLNIFLALVIDAFEEVKNYKTENPTEMAILQDAFDVTFVSLWRSKKGFPSTQLVWEFLKTSGKGFHAEVENAPAITAKELYDSVVVDHNKGQRAFRSLGHAQEFINHYVRKIVEDGHHVLAEKRENMTFNDGEGWVPSDNDVGEGWELVDACRAEPVHNLSQANQREFYSERIKMLEQLLQKAEERAQRAEDRAQRLLDPDVTHV